uniref:Uncharacterized protein n=1 Tax=Pararge aegeria TaxID=116150 RepID=S4PD15_9NEOP
MRSKLARRLVRHRIVEPTPVQPSKIVWTVLEIRDRSTWHLKNKNALNLEKLKVRAGIQIPPVYSVGTYCLRPCY